MPRTYTPDRVTSELLDWIQAVGLDPNRILMDTPITVDPEAGTVTVDYLERSDQGGLVVDKVNGGPLLSRHTVRPEGGIPDFPEAD